MAELNSSGPMLMEILYLGFLFHCYSGPINVFWHMNYGKGRERSRMNLS